MEIFDIERYYTTITRDRAQGGAGGAEGLKFKHRGDSEYLAAW